jgi:integrase
MRTAARKVRSEVPRQPHPALKEQVIQAIALETSLPVRVALALAWHAAGRVGDILRLRTADVVVAQAGVTITYRVHKTLLSRGVYSPPPLKLPPQQLALLNRWLEERKRGHQQYLFPSPERLGPQVKVALRRVSPTLEQRSLRRGALLHMAKTGVPATVLMEYSGHTTERMLRRYLSWGADLRDRANQAQAAAAALA